MEKEQLLAEIQTAFKTQNSTQLQEFAKKAVENYPEEAFGYGFLAESFMMSENPDEQAKAEICLAKASELDATNAYYLLRFAKVKEIRGEFANAYLVYSKALDLDGNNLEALLACGWYQSQQMDNCDRALEFLDKAISLDINNLTPRQYRAEALFKAGRDEEALDTLNQILSKGFSEKAASLKIMVLDNLEQHQEIDGLYQSLVQHCPTVLAYTYNYGKFLLGNEHYSAAIPILIKAIELAKQDTSNEDATLNFLLGDAYLKTAQYQEAIEQLNQVQKINSSNLYAVLLRADAKGKLKDFDGAMQDIETVSKDATFADEAHFQKGLLLAEMGKYEDAEAIFKPMTKEGIDMNKGFYGLGVARHKQGRWSNAYTLLKAAKDSYPPAALYIRQHFGGYLAATYKSLLEKNADALAANVQSPFVKKLEAGLWLFDSLKSKKLDAAPPAVVDKIKESLQFFAMVFTDKGLLWLSEDAAEFYIYKIDKGNADAAQMEFIPIDGMEVIPCKLKMDEQADSLLFSKEEGEFIKLEKRSAAQLSATFKQHAKKIVNAQKTQTLLGEKVQYFLNALFG